MNKVFMATFITLLSLVVIGGLGWLIYNDVKGNKPTTDKPQQEQEIDYKDKYTKLLADYTALNSRVEQLEKDLNESKANYATVNASLTSIKSDITALNTALKEDSDLPALENKETEELATAMQEYLTSAVSALNDKIETLSGRVKDLNGYVREQRRIYGKTLAETLVPTNVLNDSTYHAVAYKLAVAQFSENDSHIVVNVPANGKGLATYFKIYDNEGNELADSKSSAEDKVKSNLVQGSGYLKFYVDMDEEYSKIYNLQIFKNGIQRVNSLRSTYYGLANSLKIELSDCYTLDVVISVENEMGKVTLNYTDDRQQSSNDGQATTTIETFDEMYKDVTYLSFRSVANDTGRDFDNVLTTDKLVYILDNNSNYAFKMSVTSIVDSSFHRDTIKYHLVEVDNFVFIVFDSIPTEDITINISCK